MQKICKLDENESYQSNVSLKQLFYIVINTHVKFIIDFLENIYAVVEGAKKMYRMP